MTDTLPEAFAGPVAWLAVRNAITAGVDRAVILGIAVSLAVVDAGGVLNGFARMDGAEIAGERLAIDKAYTAVALRTATSELAPLAVAGGELFGLHATGGELFGLHATGGGRYVLFGGGVPVLVNNVAVGGIGVSGSRPDQDVSCAEAMLAALHTAP